MQNSFWWQPLARAFCLAIMCISVHPAMNEFTPYFRIRSSTK